MKTLAAALLVLSLAGGAVSTAQADGREHRYERRHDHRGHGHRHERRDHAHHWNHRDSYRAGYIHGRHDGRYHRGRYVRPPGYYHRAWRRGDRLPRPYYSARYVVHDYHVYGLGRPPRGYHWVRVDNDVLLAAVATGVVVHLVGGLFH